VIAGGLSIHNIIHNLFHSLTLSTTLWTTPRLIHTFIHRQATDRQAIGLVPLVELSTIHLSIGQKMVKKV
jgi:hypothetical protein